MDNPDKYTDTFQHLTLAYELLLKDVMVVLGQILSDIEREKGIKEARKSADNLHLSDNKYLTGETAVPPMDPE